MAYFAGLTAGGGVPLFVRTTPGLPQVRVHVCVHRSLALPTSLTFIHHVSPSHITQLSFPTIGTLYGTHMFVERNDARLRSTVTDNAKIVWKAFHSRCRAHCAQTCIDSHVAA